MATMTGKFAHGTNRGTKRCVSCKRNTQEGNVDRSTGLCMMHPERPGKIGCYDLAGIDNEHEDGYHDDAPDDNCSICNPGKFKDYKF